MQSSDMNRNWVLGVQIRLLLVAVIACGALAGTANAEATFVANLDASQVIGTSSETGTAIATFILDDTGENLSYSIELFGLNLVEDPAQRTGFSDVNKVHLHNGFPTETGPHVLNIFGLPSEDDAEFVVDFENNSITGVYNDADAIDPDTGELFDQNDPLTTKLFANFVDDLQGGQLYLAVHTAGQDGAIAIRGQLNAVPEPSSAIVLAACTLLCSIRRKRL